MHDFRKRHKEDEEKPVASLDQVATLSHLVTMLQFKKKLKKMGTQVTHPMVLQ
jgi:hypothetical protein